MPISLMKEIAKFKKDAYSRIHKDTLETLTKVTDDLVASGVDKIALRLAIRYQTLFLKTRAAAWCRLRNC